MVKLIGMLSRFHPVKVLVVGDFMLDTYTTGKIRRISPEAPVSVLNVLKEESRPGGAGNVVLNMISLGANVVALGRVGNDLAGDALFELLSTEGVSTEGIFVEQGFKTPVKNRFIADAQQLLRVDFEALTPLSESLEQVIVDRLPEFLDGVQTVAISDYGKCFLSRSFLMALIEAARVRNIPVIVDPKGEDFSKYQGATVIKPNLSEAYAAAKMPLDAPLEIVAKTILQSSYVDMLLITRSEAGMTLFKRSGERFDFPVRSKEVKDVTGAGDTVLAMISVALSNNLDICIAAQLANIAAGIAIEKLGCARVKLSEMANRLLEYDVENKIFSEEHLFGLEQVLKGKHYTVLGVDSLEGMSTALFRSLRKLTSRSCERKLIVYVRDRNPDEEFVSFLSSLSEVDFIILKYESLKNLYEVIHPQEVFVLENQQLIALNHASALLTA